MLIDFMNDYAWIFWLAVILVFIIIEMSSLEFTFLMLAVGAVGGLVSGLFGAPWWLQIVISAVLAVLLLFVLKPSLNRWLHRSGDPTPSNLDALMGIDGVVTTEFVNGNGVVKLANGESWTARLSPLTEIRVVADGERVVVTAIEGATAIVVPAERNAS